MPNNPYSAPKSKVTPSLVSPRWHEAGLHSRYPRVSFFIVGFLISSVSAGINMYWYDVANELLGMQVIYDTRPPWLRAVMTVADWLPWVAALLVLAARIRIGPRVRFAAYCAGALTPTALIILSLATAEPWAD
jgi:hypothetical protein